MSLLYLILGIILARLFWRQLVMAAAALALCVACYLLLRAAPAIGVAPSWLQTLYGATLIGLVAGVLLAYRVVVNFLVNQDRQREHERVDANQDKRLV